MTNPTIPEGSEPENGASNSAASPTGASSGAESITPPALPESTAPNTGATSFSAPGAAASATPNFPTMPPAASTTTAAPPADSVPSKLGRLALILGIVAFVGAFIPLINFATGFIGLAGVIIGIVALVTKFSNKGSALTGLILSAIAIIVSVILAIVYSVTFIGFQFTNWSNNDRIIDYEPITSGTHAPFDDSDDGVRENDDDFDATVTSFGSWIDYPDGFSVMAELITVKPSGTATANPNTPVNIAVTLTNETARDVVIDGVPELELDGVRIDQDGEIVTPEKPLSELLTIPAGETVTIEFAYVAPSDKNLEFEIDFTDDRESATFFN